MEKIQQANSPLPALNKLPKFNHSKSKYQPNMKHTLSSLDLNSWNISSDFSCESINQQNRLVNSDVNLMSFSKNQLPKFYIDERNSTNSKTDIHKNIIGKKCSFLS